MKEMVVENSAGNVEGAHISVMERVKGFFYYLRTDKTSLYYKLSQASLRKHTPTFALVITLGLIIFYYWMFFSSDMENTILPVNNLFYLTLYSITMAMAVFVASSLDRDTTLNNAFLYMLVLAFAVYTLLGGVLYDTVGSPYALTFTAAIMMMGAVTYPNFLVFLLQSVAGFAVVIVPHLLKFGFSVPASGVGSGVFQSLTVLGLVFALAVVLNRYVYVFVSKMVFESESWLERSETDQFTKFLNRDGLNKIYTHISQVRTGTSVVSQDNVEGELGNGEDGSETFDTHTEPFSAEIIDEHDVKGVEELLVSKKTKALYDKLYMSALLRGEVYLYFLDVDNLKRINDVFGHVEGDNAILAVSNALSHVIGNEGLIARWGGDEFVVLIGEKKEREVLEEDINAWLEENLKKVAYHRTGNALQSVLKGHNVNEQKPDGLRSVEYYQNFYKVSVTVGEPVNIIGKNMREVILLSDETLYRNKFHKKGTNRDS